MELKPKIISVIGPNVSACTPEIYAFGQNLGEALMDAGYRVVCGGMGGLMEAVCKGAHASRYYVFGATIGILPVADKGQANEYVDVAIPTGIGIARNQVVVNTGDAVIAVAGGAGTLSEIAFAWQLKKPVMCVTGFGGWSEEMAGIQVDGRQEEVIAGADSVEKVMEWLADQFQGPVG